MNLSPDERRKYDRYETDIQIQFYVNFDLKTKIRFRVKEQPTAGFSEQKYPATGKNISVEGICFNSSKELNIGDKLLLEVYVPAVKDPVFMEGVVRWIHPVPGEGGGAATFDTGAKLLKVNDEPVEKTIVVDHVHNIAWSIVLESVFGGFKHAVLNIRGGRGPLQQPKEK